ncbi:hypothetical protein GCM10011379_10250 [Filimonas zeae]|uniref:Uncharacterized protein n=2 Tax=Filimonas zeae TaxID=1737353 RepID=A0A917IQH1_9BACT|nr:hypothetical protein GCM10011379_10250 [Filimonas zeae]
MATSIGQNVLIVEDEFIVANDLEMMLDRAKYRIVGIASSVQEALVFIDKQKPDIVILDIMLQGQQTGIELAKMLANMVIPFVYLSANSNPGTLEEAKATHPYGFLVKPFREKDVLVTLQMALYRHAHSLETCIRKEQSLKIALYDIFSQRGEWKQKMQELNQLFDPFIPHDYLFAGLINDQDVFPMLGVSQIGRDEYQHIGVTELAGLSGFSVQELGLILPDFFLVNSGICQGSDFGSLKSSNKFVDLLAGTLRFGASLVYQLQLSQGLVFLISFFRRQSDGFHTEHLALLERLKEPLMLTIDRRIAFEEIDKLRKRLEEENHFLQEEVKTNIEYGEIVGASKSLSEVFKKIEQVSAIDTSVLILGESGTGKELVARSIHNRSPRKNKILVKVNCAALPPSLIESELFGHEKGAFTGAIERRIGKFELANGGTIFLDEIGEMPLELQARLLRVLQEKEIERLGGKDCIKVDVRIIAATNRDLEKEVGEGRFRLDLYYRLNVFPILLPALRDRKEDIPLLADFFGKKLCRKVGKPFRGIDERAMIDLLQYQWPGNIRELENVIEQAAIVGDGQGLLTLGRQLINKAIEPGGAQGSTSGGGPKTLLEIKQLQQQTEREHILTVLKKANGRIRGKNGAAELLNLKPTTLESRMEKLGISRSNI